jgi:hypothetical protein
MAQIIVEDLLHENEQNRAYFLAIIEQLKAER